MLIDRDVQCTNNYTLVIFVKIKIKFQIWSHLLMNFSCFIFRQLLVKFTNGISFVYVWVLVLIVVFVHFLI